MMDVDVETLDVFRLEDALWIAQGRIGVARYDFAFDNFFACRRPFARPEKIEAVGRFGAMINYSKLYETLGVRGIKLIHTPQQHLLASELPRWYPVLADLTPRSMWLTTPPSVEEIEREFSYPIFIKGSRQTSRHKAALSIVRRREDCRRVIEHFKTNPILHHQEFVCREFVELRQVEVRVVTDKIPPAFEFRTFWWRKQCVGAGAYWSEFANYDWTREEQHAALRVASEAAQRLNAVFLTIDVAQDAAGKWIVIECNDGQESGYNGVAPIALWQKILDVERETMV